MCLDFARTANNSTSPLLVGGGRGVPPLPRACASWPERSPMGLCALMSELCWSPVISLAVRLGEVTTYLGVSPLGGVRI